MHEGMRLKNTGVESEVDWLLTDSLIPVEDALASLNLYFTLCRKGRTLFLDSKPYMA